MLSQPGRACANGRLWGAEPLGGVAGAIAAKLAGAIAAATVTDNGTFCGAAGKCPGCYFAA